MRPPRIDYPGARHHVMNRGARKRDIFLDQLLFEYFLGLMEDFPERFGLRVHAYALMPNHFHLMLTSDRGELARGMKHLSACYTRMVNARYGWDGPLFRGRYKNRVVDHDPWWRYLPAYLHMNPERAELDPDGPYTRTSHDVYVGREPAPTWLDTDEVVGMYGSRQGYIDAMAGAGAEALTAPPGFDAIAMWRPHPSRRPRPPQPDGSAEVRLATALAEVSAATGLDLDALTNSCQGRGGNKAGWLALWWADRRRGVDHGRLARRFRTTFAEVSRRIRRVEERAPNDDELRRWMSALDHLVVHNA